MSKISEALGEFWYWCVDHWNVCIIAIAVVSVLGFGGLKKYQAAEKEEHRREARVAARKEAARREAEAAAMEARMAPLREWPQLPAPPLPAMGTPPQTPVLEPLGFTLPTSVVPQPGSPEQIALSLRLKQLVEAHPRTEVSNGFNQAVTSGELLLNFQTQSWEFATFGVIRSSDVAAIQHHDSRALLPTFSMSLMRLSGLRTAEEVHEAWLVLFHEYHHFEQWRKQPKDERRFWVSRQVAIDEHLSTEECDFHWGVERDAYGAECRLAMDWGMPDIWDGLCRPIGDAAAFDQSLFDWISARTPMKSCVQHWARVAGHPRPEAFALTR